MGSQCSPCCKSSPWRIGASHQLKIAPAFHRGASDLAGGSATSGALAVKSSRPPRSPIAFAVPQTWQRFTLRSGILRAPRGLGTPCQDPPPRDRETETQDSDRLSRRAKGDEGIAKGSALPRAWPDPAPQELKDGTALTGGGGVHPLSAAQQSLPGEIQRLSLAGSYFGRVLDTSQAAGAGAGPDKGTLFRTLGSGSARRGGWWLWPVPLSPT